MGITIKSELQEVKYVFVPYDKTNDDFNLDVTTMSEEDFEALYSNSAYTKGSLLDNPIDGGEKGATWETDINISENGRIYVMSVDKAYGKVTNTFTAYTSDSFYSPIEAKHKGVAELENSVVEQLYAPTTDNVNKQTSAEDRSLINDAIESALPVFSTVILYSNSSPGEAKVSLFSSLTSF